MEYVHDHHPVQRMIKWPQRSILSWARSTFGWHSDQSIAIRGNKEMAELLSALSNNVMTPQEIAMEAADVTIFMMQIAESLGYDLLGLVDAKMDINEKRTWSLLPDGSHQHN